MTTAANPAAPPALEPQPTPPSPVARRPEVRTFDIFDTLIARRGIDPAVVFAKLGESLGIPNYIEIRRQAESTVAQATGFRHDHAAIYEEVGRILGLDPAQRDSLRAREIEIELEQVIPITENLSRVRDGDILVSDMYLDEATIRRLLERAGFEKEVGLVVTNEGKAHGWIWPQLAAEFEIVEHLGDNPHSDHAVPRSLGIAARATMASAPNEAEQLLINVGLPELGQLCRELRLLTWDEDPTLRMLQAIQAGLNFPLMLVASIYLGRLVGRLGVKRLAFSSRDCFLWLPLFRRVAAALGVQCEATYFYTSRAARRRPSPAYLRYVRELAAGDTLVVDVCGTGWSMSHLAAAAGLDGLPVFLIHRKPKRKLYEDGQPSLSTCRFYTVIPETAQDLDNFPLEMCNTATHGMVTDVRLLEGHVAPVFAPETRSARELAAVRVQNAAFNAGTAMVDRYDLSRLFALGDDELTRLLTVLYQAIIAQPTLGEVYLAGARQEDDRACLMAGMSGATDHFARDSSI